MELAMKAQSILLKEKLHTGPYPVYDAFMLRALLPTYTASLMLAQVAAPNLVLLHLLYLSIKVCANSILPQDSQPCALSHVCIPVWQDMTCLC